MSAPSGPPGASLDGNPDGGARHPPTVHIVIPGDAAYVRLARLMASAMGAALDMSVDDLDDLRLAVNELCGWMVESGADRIEIDYQNVGGRLAVVGVAPGAALAPGDPDDKIRATILEVACDSYAVDATPGGVTFRFERSPRPEG